MRTNDLHEQVELEIRTSLDSLHSAEEQFKVAEEGLTLSDSEFTQARRRYAAGVASFIDVLDAERTTQQNELLLADSSTAVSIDLVVLYKALGGGW